MKKFLLRLIIALSIIIVGIVLLIIGAIAVYDYNISYGEGEGISGLNDLPLPDSSWVIRNRVMGSPSPMGGSGWLNVVANDKATGKQILILSLSDIQTPIQEAYEKPNHVIITLPNRTDILEQHDSFANFTVSYKFTPKDDPADRAAYQFWWRHPKDAKAIEWCMKNLPSKNACNP